MTTSSGLTFYVTFDEFRISDGFSNYKLVSTGGYNGVAGTVGNLTYRKMIQKCAN